LPLSALKHAVAVRGGSGVGAGVVGAPVGAGVLVPVDAGGELGGGVLVVSPGAGPPGSSGALVPPHATARATHAPIRVSDLMGAI